MAKKTTDKANEHTQAQIKELEHNWKRALADYQNLQKRVDEERIELFKFANQTLILKLLPVLDNLEQVANHVQDDGIELTLKTFRQVLQEEGVMEIETLGKQFDLTTMDAIDVVKTENDQDSGKVVEVIEKGYMLKNKILRPAKVKVGH